MENRKGRRERAIPQQLIKRSRTCTGNTTREGETYKCSSRYCYEIIFHRIYKCVIRSSVLSRFRLLSYSDNLYGDEFTDRDYLYITFNIHSCVKNPHFLLYIHYIFTTYFLLSLHTFLWSYIRKIFYNWVGNKIISMKIFWIISIVKFFARAEFYLSLFIWIVVQSHSKCFVVFFLIFAFTIFKDPFMIACIPITRNMGERAFNETSPVEKRTRFYCSFAREWLTDRNDHMFLLYRIPVFPRAIHRQILLLLRSRVFGMVDKLQRILDGFDLSSIAQVFNFLLR